MWNADIYVPYGKERIQPSLDLIYRIRERNFDRILDVGCGTGMNIAPLVNTWDKVEIIDVDLSEEMLQEARGILAIVTFIQRDCSQSLEDLGRFDLILKRMHYQMKLTYLVSQKTVDSFVKCHTVHLSIMKDGQR